MGSKTTTTQKNTYGYQQPPTTSQQGDFDTWAQTSFNQADPNIPYAFNNMREASKNQINNPFGSDFSPEVSNAVKYKEGQDINQMQGQATREDAFNRKLAKGQALQVSAQGHAPQLTQTGGTGTTVQNPGMMSLIGAGLQAGASVGSAAMM